MNIQAVVTGFASALVLLFGSSLAYADPDKDEARGKERHEGRGYEGANTKPEATMAAEAPGFMNTAIPTLASLTVIYPRPESVESGIRAGQQGTSLLLAGATG